MGINWDIGAISTSEWSGVYLKDIINFCLIEKNNISEMKHVIFEA